MQERFTISEVVLMGWRSQEQTYQMRQRMDSVKSRESRSDGEEIGVVYDDGVRTKKKGKKKKQHKYGSEDVIPEGLPERFYNEEGEVDLSKVKLKDALKYMNTLGIKMPMPTQGKRSGVSRDVEKPPSMNDMFGSG